MRPGLALAFALVLLPAGLLAAGGPDLTAAEAVFQAKCSECHPVDRALKKRKDRAAWEKTVTRMRGYAGGRISEGDAALIVEYLTRVRGPAQ